MTSIASNGVIIRQKSAMFLASTVWLKKDWRAFSRYIKLSGLDPAVVVEFVRQAISLVGNASFCGLSDRRKSLLAKVSPESLDLLDERNLFEKNSADLFSKKFKKAMLKEFKHDKIMDNLFGRSSHGNRKQFFHQQPGKGPGFFPGTNARPGIRQWSESPQNRGWQTAKTQFRSFAPGTKRRYQQSGK